MKTEFEKVGELLENTLVEHLKNLHPCPLPYQNLLIRLIAQALGDWFSLRRYTNGAWDRKKAHKATIAESAYAWIMSDVEWFGVKKGRRVGTISYVSACQALDVDPEAIRRILHINTFDELERIGRVYLSCRNRGGDSEDPSGWNSSSFDGNGASRRCGGDRVAVRTAISSPDD